MSVLGDLDGMILREVVNPPLTTKNSELTVAEWDDRVIAMYNAFQDIVSGVNVEAYDPASTYDGTSSDVYEKFAGYGGRIWQAVFAGTFTGQTPAEGIYWTQITLAQLLPNVLKLAEIASGPPCHCVQVAKLVIPSSEVLQLNTTPKAFGLTVPAGYYVQPLRLVYQLDYGTSDYDTNTDIAVIGSVSSVNIIIKGTALLAASSNTFLFDILGSGMTNTSTPMDGEDLLVTEPTGNPLNGDSDITIYLTYILIEI